MACQPRLLLEERLTSDHQTTNPKPQFSKLKPLTLNRKPTISFHRNGPASASSQKTGRGYLRGSARASLWHCHACASQIGNCMLQTPNHKPQTPNPNIQSPIPAACDSNTQPLSPPSHTNRIMCARTSASTIVTSQHSRLCHHCLLTWASATAVRAAARAHARARAETPLAFAFDGGLRVGWVFRGWRGLVARARVAGEWVRGREGKVMAGVMCAWRGAGAGGRRRSLGRLGVLKKLAEDRVTRIESWLTCSRTISAWRHVTLRINASRASLHNIITRHHHGIITAGFKSWAMRSRTRSRATALALARARDPFRFAVGK